MLSQKFSPWQPDWLLPFSEPVSSQFAVCLPVQSLHCQHNGFGCKRVLACRLTSVYRHNLTNHRSGHPPSAHSLHWWEFRWRHLLLHQWGLTSPRRLHQWHSHRLQRRSKYNHQFARHSSIRWYPSATLLRHKNTLHSACHIHIHHQYKHSYLSEKKSGSILWFSCWWTLKSWNRNALVPVKDLWNPFQSTAHYWHKQHP